MNWTVAIIVVFSAQIIISWIFEGKIRASRETLHRAMMADLDRQLIVIRAERSMIEASRQAFREWLEEKKS